MKNLLYLIMLILLIGCNSNVKMQDNSKQILFNISEMVMSKTYILDCYTSEIPKVNEVRLTTNNFINNINNNKNIIDEVINDLDLHFSEKSIWKKDLESDGYSLYRKIRYNYHTITFGIDGCNININVKLN